MENFKIWMLSLCGATAITSLFKILLSNSSLNKVLNIFFSVFILFYMVMPIHSFINDLSYKSIDDTPMEYAEIYRNGYKEIIEISIENICEKADVEILSFEISSYVNDDGYLYVEEMEIDIDKNEKIDEIKTEIKKQLGYEVTVK